MKYKIVSLALLFLDYSKTEPEPERTQESKKEIELKERIREELIKRGAFYDAHNPIDFNSHYIRIQLNKELEEATRLRKKGARR